MQYLTDSIFILNDILHTNSSFGSLCVGVCNSLLGLFSNIGTLMVVPTTLSTLAAEPLVLAVCIDGNGDASLDAMFVVELTKILCT